MLFILLSFSAVIIVIIVVIFFNSARCSLFYLFFVSMQIRGLFHYQHASAYVSHVVAFYEVIHFFPMHVVDGGAVTGFIL